MDVKTRLHFYRVFWHRALQLVLTPGLLCVTIQGHAQSENSQVDSVFSAYQQAQQLERRAKRLAAHWREEIRLQLIRSRDQIDAKTADWLDGEEFTGTEFKVRFEEALLISQSMGMDPDRMRRYLELLKRAIRRADLRQVGQTYAEDVPATSVEAALSWFEAGVETYANNSAERQTFRAALYRRTSLLFLDALLEREPRIVVDKLKQLERAIKSIQGADVMLLAAETESLIATQTLIADVAAGFPVVGETIDAISLIKGETPAGEALDNWGKAFALIGLVPVAGDLVQMVRRSPDSISAMAKMAVGIDNASSESLQAIAQAAGRDVATLKQTTGQLKQIPEVQAATRGLGTDALMNKTNRAMTTSLDDSQMQAANELWRSVQKNAESSVNQLKTTLAERAEALDPQVLADYVAVRSNNLAVKTLQKADASTRVRVSSIEEELFGGFVKTSSGEVVNAGNGLVDQATFRSIQTELKPALELAVKNDNMVEEIGRLNKEPLNSIHFVETQLRVRELEGQLSTGRSQLAALPAGDAAQKIVRSVKRRKRNLGESFFVGDTLATDSLSVEVFNATNDIPVPGKIGTDRDATFRVVDSDGDRIDIPAKFARRHYAVSLYETLNPGQKINPADPADMEKALAFASQMDHAITDSVDAEAYLLYDAELTDIMGGGARDNPVELSRIDAESIQRTFEFKGFHLLEPVPGNPGQTMINRVEAMRQIRKQFDNLIVPRLTQGGKTLESELPARTVVAYRLFQQVESNDITPAQVEAGLSAIGLTLEQAFLLMAEGINFSRGRP